MQEILTQVGQMSPVLMMGLGLSIGLQHAFEPDHISAVSTQISGKRQTQSTKQLIKSGTARSSMLGALWGAGHTTTLVLMGLVAYVLAVKIEQNVFSGFELIVGIMLMFLATTTILNKRIIRHKHPHQHQDGSIHYDTHDHADTDHTHKHKSYLIGCIHGLAGSGSLVVLSASALSSVGATLWFILIFGIGSIIGMTLISGVMGVPFALSNKTAKINKIIRYSTGTLSLLIGANIVYQITIADNLFGI
jgi:high-affinity nickel permease